jgi:hypothetical protein
VKDCHKCPVAKEIEEGKYKGTPWEKTPCAKCLASRRTPFCATCPVSKRIEKGDLIGVPFRALPCATCRHFYEHDPLSHHGRTHIRYEVEDDERSVDPDPIEEDEPEDDHPIFDEHDPDAEHRNHLKPSVAAMSYVAKALVGLPEITREVVLDRLAYPTKPMVDTAKRLNVAKSTVHDHLKRARKEWPALAWAIPMKSWTVKKR